MLGVARERRRRARRHGVPAVFAFLLAPVSLGAQEGTQRFELLDQLADGGAAHWTNRDLGRRPTRYEVVRTDGRLAIRGTSERSASGLWRDVSIARFTRGTVAWQWRVDSSLSSNQREREKRGDDYAARVFVVFDTGKAAWNSRALCYVWAGREPVESVFRSPYVRQVATVVVESGDARAGEWVPVTRDLVADHRRAFGEPPGPIAAVALMVDSDDTESSATAYFAELVLEIGR